MPVLIRAASLSSELTDAGVFYAVDLTRWKKSACSAALPNLLSLTKRQLEICLLMSLGESDKRIAALLNMSVRTIETDKHRAAKQLRLPTSNVIIWAVEHRRALIAAIKNRSSTLDTIVEIIHRLERE